MMEGEEGADDTQIQDIINAVIDNEESPDLEDIQTAPTDLIYSIEDVPPWYLCIVLGFQHILTASGATITVPLLLAEHFCLANDTLGLSEIISTIFFVSGISTLLQTTVGVRLPIIQSSTFTFLTPTIAILSSQQWACPYKQIADGTYGGNVSLVPEVGSDEHKEMWQMRVREIQGAVILASLIQVVIGFSGLMGVIMRFVGPLAVVPTVSLIGLSLFDSAAQKASSQWWISSMTMFLIALFSQYLRNIKIPRTNLEIFKLFPVLLAMCLAWSICAILTASGALPEGEGEWGYLARTDIRSDVLNKAEWFRFPYPGQWGTPTVSTASVFGMFAGVFASMIESVGDYYACARLSGAPPPPTHAVNRGIGIEGLSCMLAGIWGSGNGTTSYSENIGAIGITKVGSRRVVQVAGVILLILGCLGKVGALFVSIPDPIVRGMFTTMFGVITAVGLSNLQFVDLRSSRNLFVLGMSLFFGLAFPNWMNNNMSSINTGSALADQIIGVLLSTSMFIGGMLGFVLDNTIPGTDEERGIKKWRVLESSYEDSASTTIKTYDIPFIQKYLDRWKWTKFFPFCPGFNPKLCLQNLPCFRKGRRHFITDINGEVHPSSDGKTYSMAELIDEPQNTKFDVAEKYNKEQ